MRHILQLSKKRISNFQDSYDKKEGCNGNLHIALPGIIIGVLVDAVGLAALSKPSKKPTDGHPNLVILMKIPAIIPLHTQTPQPVPAYRLPEILLGNLLPGI